MFINVKWVTKIVISMLYHWPGPTLGMCPLSQNLPRYFANVINIRKTWFNPYNSFDRKMLAFLTVVKDATHGEKGERQNK